MGKIATVQRTAYFAPTRRRHFLTLKTACRSEAWAMMLKKYPTEHGSHHEGDSGWHWLGDELLVKVCARLTRRIYRAALKHGGGQ